MYKQGEKVVRKHNGKPLVFYGCLKKGGELNAYL